MQDFLDWLAGLPSFALYAALAATAAAENLFPPLPADTVVAFGAFLAARGQATLLGAFLSTWAGNVVGALVVYALGRKFGAAYAHRMMSRFGGAGGESRIESMYEKHGLVALFLSRFIPALRALVPPFAGALKIPPVPAALAIAGASAVWYGVVTWIAYRVGSNWDALLERLRSAGVWAAVIAGVLVALAVAWFLVKRRRARS